MTINDAVRLAGIWLALNENNKHSSDMRIKDIQNKLNVTYGEAKKFKEQVELLGLFGVSGIY